MNKILWIGVFTDNNGEQNWLFFSCEDNHTKAVKAFKESYKESFDEEYDRNLDQGDPEVYPVTEVDGYNIKLEAKNA